MKIVLINGKVFDKVETVKQTDIVIMIVPIDTDKENIEDELIVIPWTSILYMI